MKKFVAKIIVFATVLTSNMGCRARADELIKDDSAIAASNSRVNVFHVVAFRFKTDDESRRQIAGVVKAFANLQYTSVDPNGSGRRLIQSFHAGQNSSTEQVSFGTKGQLTDRTTEWTFILTFSSIADRDYYVDKDPAHQAFKKLVGPLLDGGSAGVFVTDFAQRF